MENQDLLPRLRQYASGLEDELKGAFKDKATWTNVSNGMHRSLGAYAGLQIITTQEREGLQEACYSIRNYGRALVKFYQAFPEIKTIDELYAQFPDLKQEVEE